MKSISPALKAALAGEVRTLAWLYNVTRLDGVTVDYTTHDEDLVVDGVTCKAASAFRPSQIEASTNLAPDNMDVVGILGDVSEADVAAGKYDRARVRYTLVDWTNPANKLLVKVYFVGEIKVSAAGRYSFTLLSLQELMQKPQGRLVTPTCSTRLGSTQCGVTVTPVAATVTTTDGSKLITAAALSGATADIFRGGVVAWTTGANAGARMEVREHPGGGVLGLWLPMAAPIVVGDEFTVVEGCDGQYSTCLNRFNNVLNFRGFPKVAGTDQIVRAPDAPSQS